MTTVIITIHIMLVLALIVLVLLQRSEGGALGIGGGGGGGGGFMSARGAADALTRTTTIVAAGFFFTSIALGVIAKSENTSLDLLDRIEGTQNTGVPTDSGSSADTLLEDLMSAPSDNSAEPGVPGAPASE